MDPFDADNNICTELLLCNSVDGDHENQELVSIETFTFIHILAEKTYVLIGTVRVEVFKARLIVHTFDFLSGLTNDDNIISTEPIPLENIGVDRESQELEPVETFIYNQTLVNATYVSTDIDPSSTYAVKLTDHNVDFTSDPFKKHSNIFLGVEMVNFTVHHVQERENIEVQSVIIQAANRVATNDIEHKTV